MIFLIPTGGIYLNSGKRLLKLAQGEYNTDDKEIIKLLQGSKAKEVKKAVKPKAE